jgi:hypothetical protein
MANVFGQDRKPAQLPVLTMVIGYSGLAVSGVDTEPDRAGSVGWLVAADHRPDAPVSFQATPTPVFGAVGHEMPRGLLARSAR